MIRNYQPGDHKAISEIFPRAVHKIASQYYTKEQCSAWSGKTPNPTHWEKRCEVKRPFVYMDEGMVVGFLELDSDGHIDCTYVHPDHARKGIASRLIDHAMEHCSDTGLSRMYVEASICAKPVFERKGFQVVRKKLVKINDQQIINFDMELLLANDK